MSGANAACAGPPGVAALRPRAFGGGVRPIKNRPRGRFFGDGLVERMRIELTTSALRTRRSPS